MVVGNDGRLYEGRGYDVHGAHAGVHNTNSIGISVVGNFMEVEPSDLVLQSIYDCIDCAQQEVKTAPLCGNWGGLGWSGEGWGNIVSGLWVV